MAKREFEASVNELQNVNSFVESELINIGCSPKTIMQIQLATEELFVNIAHYAYSGKGGKMQLSIEQNENMSVILQFSDNGVRFNPLERQDPDTTMKAEDREIGGLGIFMTKKIADNISYKYESGQNIVIITKNIRG